MMEENNRKGPGIFYAVVGVATLVVAIIGATFAYFSANAQDDATIKGSTASAGGIDLAVTPVGTTSSNLIPLNLILGATDTVDQFDKAMAGGCKDVNGNNVCQVYKVVVKNKSTTSTIQIRGYLTLSSGATNMYYRLIDLTTEDDITSGTKVGYSTDVQATSAGTKGNLTVGGNSGGDSTNKDVASKSLAAEESATYYVVVWLEEMGTAQETADAAKDYSGKVEFEAVDAAGNSSGITASFTGAA